MNATIYERINGINRLEVIEIISRKYENYYCNVNHYKFNKHLRYEFHRNFFYENKHELKNGSQQEQKILNISIFQT